MDKNIENLSPEEIDKLIEDTKKEIRNLEIEIMKKNDHLEKILSELY